MSTTTNTTSCTATPATDCNCAECLAEIATPMIEGTPAELRARNTRKGRRMACWLARERRA